MFKELKKMKEGNFLAFVYVIGCSTSAAIIGIALLIYFLR